MDVYKKKILIVDDDTEILLFLGSRLTNLGYKIFLASNGKDALTSFYKELPDLLIFDLILPKLDGYKVCRKIRAHSQVPMLIVTSLPNISDRITGLELGADDFVIKPFSPKELEARIKSLLRRSKHLVKNSSSRPQKIVKIGNVIIDFNTRTIETKYSKVKLTGIEYSLLELLIDNPGKQLSRSKILNNVWGYTPERYIDTRIIDVHISRLRSKLELDPVNPELIITVRGIGYMFRK